MIYRPFRIVRKTPNVAWQFPFAIGPDLLEDMLMQHDIRRNTLTNMTSKGSMLMPSLKASGRGVRPALQSKASMLRQLTPCMPASIRMLHHGCLKKVHISYLVIGKTGLLQQEERKFKISLAPSVRACLFLSGNVSSQYVSGRMPTTVSCEVMLSIQTK